VNSNDGTLGLLMNDKKLYQNLESTSRSLNILLDDFRVHPKRYVNVSVFGKKRQKQTLNGAFERFYQPTNRQVNINEVYLFLYYAVAGNCM
jgi:phospholipid/cholesterol/gamma-HCH transport system substrate-binding protein